MRNTFTEAVSPRKQPIPGQWSSRTGTNLLWTRTSKLKEVWGVVRTLRSWPDVSIRPDSAGLCFAIKDLSVGHLRWDGQLDLPFGAEVLAGIVPQGTVIRDPDLPQLDWVVFQIRTDEDVQLAVWLLRLSYLIVDSKSPRKCG